MANDDSSLIRDVLSKREQLRESVNGVGALRTQTPATSVKDSVNGVGELRPQPVTTQQKQEQPTGSQGNATSEKGS